MKIIKILLSVISICSLTSVYAQRNQITPWATFQGDSVAYLVKNFGTRSGNTYFQDDAVKIFDLLELPIQSTMFVIDYNQYHGYSFCTAIYLFFQSSDYVTKRRQAKQFGNCIILITEWENYEKESEILKSIIKDRRSTFIVEYDGTIEKCLKQLHYNNAYYTPLVIE